jgi:hypothetical protein
LAIVLPIQVLSVEVPKLFVRHGRGEISMFVETMDVAYTSRRRTKGHQLVSLIIALVFALTIYPSKAHAQIVGDLEVNIPFQFHAGNTKLPPGKYLIHMLDDADLTFMEISSVDGSTSALFEVQAAAADSAPDKSELIFNKYGDRYFLAEVFEEGNRNGSKVVESRYEKRISQEDAAAHENASVRHEGQQ